MNGKPIETCMIFVDDSNIWIEAQKFAASGNSHMPKLTDCDRDPRLRIDIGKLINTLCNGRRQGPSFLYGSRPPPNDSVWEAFKKREFEAKIYDRARGKEKEVDNSMATDLISEATDLKVRAEFLEEAKEKKAATTFVVITGDRDMLPSIKRMLEFGIRVELWAWESGLSSEYLKLSHREDIHQEGLLSVKLLNWIFDKISFTNFLSTRQIKTNQVDPSKTIVLYEFSDLVGDDPEAFLCKTLLELTRLFYFTRSKNESEMFVEFPKANYIETVIKEARKLFNGTLKVVSWPEYASRFNKDPPDMVETSNMYAPLTDDNDQGSTDATAKEEEGQPEKEQGGEEEEKYGKAKPSNTAEGECRRIEKEGIESSNKFDDNGGWTTVTRSNLGKAHGSKMRQDQQCRDRLHCRKRGDCGYLHTDKERDLFRDNPKQDFGLWKTKECTKNYCHRGKQCSYAHTQEEAWCRLCHQEGHFTERCFTES
ncbi:hypothetical protein BGZ63DRAFT_383010 [Mariannaea sp. PMI_226]|nr:hypothetical protein BGZ63DRAFT_383010 [Mariannaea sp. PMI_226]